MKKNLLLASLLGFANLLSAQQIIAGPVVGGVTPNSARLFVMLDRGAQVELFWDSTSNFNAPNSLSATVDSTDFFSHIFEINNLTEATTYYYQFKINGGNDTLQGSFRSFPGQGTDEVIRIAVGSCNYGPGPDLFQDIVDFNPHLVLHLGDWNFPPGVLGFEFMKDSSLAAESFRMRYNDEMFRDFILRRFPVDFIYDDDYAYNDSEGWSYPLFSVTTDSTGSASTNLWTVRVDSAIRKGALQAYAKYFPGYPLIDADGGIHHKIEIGGTEIFMLDCRNNRWPRHDAFLYDSASGLWSYSPPPGHSMLGQSQRSWLLDGLRQSSADWKIIGSSVVMNQGYERILNLGIDYQRISVNFQGQNQSGAVLASQMAYNWVGYPLDHDSLLHLYNTGQIKDVAVVSGDSHSAGIDDGDNAGLPELNTSGWAAGDEAELFQVMDQYLGIFGQGSVKGNLWSGGASGVDGNSTLDPWGSIEIFGRDSMRLCAYDRQGDTLGCVTLLHSSFATGSAPIDAVHSDIRVFPNPFGDALTIQCEPESEMLGAVLKILNINGQEVWKGKAREQLHIDTKLWASGAYFVYVSEGENQYLIQKIIHP